MPTDPKPPAPAAHITFEQFTESTLGAVFRAVQAHKIPHRPIIIGLVFDPQGGGGYGGTQMNCGFAAVVKPFFTDCYRQHMLFKFDLWLPNDVKNNWQGIHDAVNNGSMPAPGCPGTFNKQGFLDAFQCWKDQGFPP
ncbi:MAG: hypothetical protein DMF85_16875 [Acidobacteria bacterium]|nr:MAG: hypothetical protein DMF85_16875 [Acidobacteriota bacterium]